MSAALRCAAPSRREHGRVGAAMQGCGGRRSARRPRAIRRRPVADAPTGSPIRPSGRRKEPVMHSLRRVRPGQARGAGAAPASPHAVRDHARCRGALGRGVGGARAGGGCCRSAATTTSTWATHPAVVAAAVEATRRHGTGAGASRLVSGNHALFAGAGSQAGAAEGDGGGLRVRLGVPGERGDRAGAGGIARPGAGGCAGGTRACGRGRSSPGARVLAFRHNDVAHLAGLLAAERGAHPAGRWC